MSHKKIVSKIAVDKNSLTLGKIVRIDKLLGKTVKKYKFYAMIKVKKFLKKTVNVPIDVDVIIKVEGSFVWFDITKKEFDEEYDRIRKMEIEREIFTGDTGYHRGRRISSGYIADPYRLTKRGKERKK